MGFNPVPSKQAHKFIFSCKLQKLVYLSLHFINIGVTQTTIQKHLGTLFDLTWNFPGHLKNIYSKVNKTKGLLLKINNASPRFFLLIIY